MSAPKLADMVRAQNFFKSILQAKIPDSVLLAGMARINWTGGLLRSGFRNLPNHVQQTEAKA
jgi:hypothetical protein